MTIDWNGAVLNYCQKAYGKRRGKIIKEKLQYIDNRVFFAMRGFTLLGWFKDSYPKEKIMDDMFKVSIINDILVGEDALDEIITTAEYLKKELRMEINTLQREET